MTDTLRETLEAVVDQAEEHPDLPLTPIEPKEPPAAGSEGAQNDSAAVVATPTPAQPPQPVARTSEAPKIDDVAAAQLAAAKGKPQTEVTTQQPAQPTASVEPHITERAPASWTAEAKTAWSTLPLNIRQEVVRREKQVDEALGQSAQAREFMQQMNQMVQPYMARLNQNQVPVMQSIGNLLNADHLLATAPQPARAAFLAKIIKDYGIDVGELDQALSGQVKNSPNSGIQDAVQAAIQPLMAPVMAWQRQQAEQVVRDQQNAATEVQRMQLDPKYEHFESVRDYMADIIEMYTKRGLLISADQAYTMAIQTHPEISKVVKERSEQEAARAALARGTEAAQRAKSAAVSVGSSVPVGGSAQSKQGLSLRDTIEAAFTAAGSGDRI